MPQLDLSFYLSQIFFYLGAFSAMFVAVSFVIYPRISQAIEEREQVLMEKSEETDQIVRRAEEIREEIEQRRKALRKKLEELSSEYRSRAGAEFERIVGKANGDFQSAMAEGMEIIKLDVDKYRKGLENLSTSLVGDVLKAVESGSETAPHLFKL